jgi:8-oxo-dGTP diphosphatase
VSANSTTWAKKKMLCYHITTMNMKEAAIGIFFSDKQTEVLLVKRRDTPVWVLPGGGIDEGETPEEAAVREFFEETGLRVTPSRRVGTWVPINKLASKTYVFECVLQKNDAPLLFAPQLESLEVKLFPISNLPKPLFFLHKNWIDEALKNLPDSGELPMKELTYSKCLTLIMQHPIRCLRYLLCRFGFPINTK